ncbi:uncharacterized protein LOC130939740 [Arachis stenosperma]|uniref:uncharacterized protein LOC130939740 n=1 Tax=Arachis stenosperma TaxID=217475 RepID=UPI0025AD5152|nr:uncharacterized protein LOC130939740 [Arachis stenosperma]
MATIAEALSHLTLSPSNTHNTYQASTSSFLLSQPQPNPKGSINAITLNGHKLDEVVLEPTSLSKESHNKGMEEEVGVVGDEMENIAREEEDLLKIFKNVEVTVSFFQAIQQVLKYAKFLKDVCTHKDKIGELNKYLVNDTISSLIPEKYNDPGPYLVGGIEFMDCMCDLGARVSIMPLPIYEKLNLSPLKRSRARFVLTDKSIVSVVGIAENVLVNIQELLFPVDFQILETPPIDSDKPSSILFGRPFLKTSRFKLMHFRGLTRLKLVGK